MSDRDFLSMDIRNSRSVQLVLFSNFQKNTHFEYFFKFCLRRVQKKLYLCSVIILYGALCKYNKNIREKKERLNYEEF